MIDIRCKLNDDIDSLCRKRLEAAGYNVSDTSRLNILKQYLNVLRREVSVKPREVKVLAGLVCPIECQNGFASLQADLRSGRNVNIYLSSNLTSADYQDGFLNDYGLHHFHLGDGLEHSGRSRGFIKRTGPVLLAYVTDDVAYLIDIKMHGHNGDPYIWTDQDIVEKLHSEYPEALSKFKVNRELSSAIQPTQEERKTARSRALNLVVQMKDGTVYSCIGGGITSARTSADVQVEHDRICRQTKSMLSFMVSNLNLECSVCKYPFNFKLVAFEGCWFFHDEKNRVSVSLRFKPVDKKYIETTTYTWGKFPLYYSGQFRFNLISQVML